MSNSPNWQLVIPTEIALDDSLPGKSAILFGIVSSLTTVERGCFASNAYLAETLGTTERTIQRWLNALAKRGWIEVSYADPTTRTMREIRPSAVYTPATPVSPPRDKNVTPPRDKNVTHNNTRIDIERETRTREKFEAPTVEEVQEAFEGDPKYPPIHAEQFVNHFAASGWRMGAGAGRPMKDWKAAYRNWCLRAPQFARTNGSNERTTRPLTKSQVASLPPDEWLAYSGWVK